jgi:hypothetical protein
VPAIQIYTLTLHACAVLLLYAVDACNRRQSWPASVLQQRTHTLQSKSKKVRPRLHTTPYCVTDVCRLSASVCDILMYLVACAVLSSHTTCGSMIAASYTCAHTPVHVALSIDADCGLQQRSKCCTTCTHKPTYLTTATHISLLIQVIRVL